MGLAKLSGASVRCGLLAFESSVTESVQIALDAPWMPSGCDVHIEECRPNHVGRHAGNNRRIDGVLGGTVQQLITHISMDYIGEKLGKLGSQASLKA